MALRGRRRPARRPRRCRARVLPGRGGADDGDADALWVHELIGGDGGRPRRPSMRGGSWRCRPTRPATCWCSTPARWCRCASWWAAWDAPDGADSARSIRPPGSCVLDLDRGPDAWQADADAHRRLHDLPGHGRRTSPARACSAGPGAAGLLDVRVHDLRAATTDAHRTVDDTPFGGGAGHGADARADLRHGRGGRPAPAAAPARPGWPHPRPGLARELAALDGFSLLCGRYEGVDERVRDHLVDGELSIGDYVLGRGRGGGHGRARGGRPPGARGDGQRRVGRRRVVRRRAARVPAVHQAGRVPGLGGARGAALGRPRPGRPVAAGPGPAPHPGRPARPDRGPGRPHRRRAAPARRVRRPIRRGLRPSDPGAALPALPDAEPPILPCPPNDLLVPAAARLAAGLHAGA